MVKEFLSRKGVGFREIDVARDPSAARELGQRTGRTAVPVIIIGGQTIVGFDQARLEQAISQMQNERPAFGAAVADASRMTTRLGYAASGAYVGKVRPGSAAERLGLAPGDIITQINTQAVASAGDLESALSRLERGSHLSIIFLRDRETLSAEGAL